MIHISLFCELKICSPNPIADFNAKILIGYIPNSDNTATFTAALFTPSKYLANLICNLTGALLSI